jgi:hypothetical protein
MTCVSTENLFAWAQEALPGDEAERLSRHLSIGCETCENRLHNVQMILSATGTRGLLNAPDWLVGQAMDLFRWRISGRDSASRTIPAVLLFDSGAEGRLLGFRGAGLTSRHLLYRAGRYDIDLSIDFVGSAQLADIIGQPMPLGLDLETVANGDVELSKESTLVLATNTNEFGEFILDSIKEGVYDLKLKFKTDEIRIVGLKALAIEH